MYLLGTVFDLVHISNSICHTPSQLGPDSRQLTFLKPMTSDIKRDQHRAVYMKLLLTLSAVTVLTVS